MNGYQLIMKIQQKIQQDPNFEKRFNRAVSELNKIPGLQQQVMQIVQITNDNQRQKAINRLPERARQTVEDIIDMLDN